MRTRAIIFATILCYFVLYAPQPLLSIFAQQYDVSMAGAGSLMMATLLPLAAAPLFYGYLLSLFAPLVMLRVALLGMALSCLAFSLSDNFYLTFVLRLVQGLLLPAALTSTTTHIAAFSRCDSLQRNMSVFITATIIGGLLGRIAATAFAHYFSWQLFYLYLAAALLLSCLLIGKTYKRQVKVDPDPHFKRMFEIFTTAAIGKLLISVWCLFFCFTAVLSYLPFMLQPVLKSDNILLVGLMYSGMLMAIVTSLNAQRLTNLLGSGIAVMVVGSTLFTISLGGLLVEHIWSIFGLLFVFCGTMFLVHSVAAAEVNRRCKKDQNIVNSMYVSFYYGGGVVGAYLPGLLYQAYGRELFLCLLLTVALFGLLLLLTEIKNK